MLNGITVAKGFQTSVNIAFDLHNDEKVKNFIPTMSSIDIVEDVLHSINSPGQSRARLLVGAYGRGKSHIILVLMSMLFKKDVALFGSLLKKMGEFNPKLCEFVLEYLRSDITLLPVIVSGNSASLTQSFLNALQQTLKNENLERLMPETNFVAAVNTIEKWRKDYPDTYKRFIRSLDEPISKFMVSLKEFDVNAYDRFITLYPALTSGSQFNPFVGFDVIELYEKVVDKLKDEGYSGIYIIYDEFSKYLEASIASATVSDTKLLQDFAEKCDRSGDKQIHMMLISHKDIANYIDNNLPKEKVDGWRGVSGRFKHLSLRNNFAQMYEIISAVIRKEPKAWTRFTKKFGSRFSDMENRFVTNGILEQDIAEVAVKGCYPLHPVSTFVLPRLSEKVAQNERTLFTFLSAEHRHTLSAFLEAANGDFDVLTPDYLYDYFEPLLRKEHYTSDTHKQYKLTAKVLDKLDADSLGAKIIKTISLIYIIEQYEKLPPIYNRIVDAYIDSIGEVSIIADTLKQLIDEEYIIYHKKSNGYLKIKDSSGVDIQSEIESEIEKTRGTISVKKILNESAFDSYMYPTGYNDEMEITRFFSFTFIDSTEFFVVENWERKIEDEKETTGADGIIYAVIPDSERDIERIKKAITKTADCKHERILFIVPKKFVDIEKICFEYNSAKSLKNRVVDDTLLTDEYDIFIDDLEEVIGSYILSYSRPETGGAEYFHRGKRLNFKRKAQISAKLSDICFNTYPHTPVINNESINMDSLQTVAVNSRNKLLSGLLESELDINLGLTGTGQDVSFMRSTLIQTGVLQDEAEKPIINLLPDDKKMAAVLSEISDFLTGKGGQGSSFKGLYNTLTLPQYGYGMKKGVLPIYIAAVLHHHKKYIVIKDKSDEVKITPDLLNSINEAPEIYKVYMENWSNEKSQYIDGLAALFSDFVLEKEKDYNTFQYITLAMSRWYMNLPKYAKELKEVYHGKDVNGAKDKAITAHIKFLSSLKQSRINAREYLFVTIFKIYGYEDFTIDVVSDVKSAKNLFDGAKAGLLAALANDMKAIFGKNEIKKATLSSVVKDWCEGLKPTTINHLFANNEDKVLQLMTGIGNNESQFIEQLARVVTGLRVDDWDKANIAYFVGYLENLKKAVTEFDREYSSKSADNAEMYRLSFIGKDGKEVVKTFEKMEYTEKAKLLRNAITVELEDMGQAITEQEKRQVLMELLEKMC